MALLIRNRWLSIGCRLLLGVVFIYAAIHKIEDPGGFAKVIWGYKMLPAGLVNLLALYLPWVELAAGLALVLGIYKRGAAGLIGAMLVVFSIAISVNLLRGIDFDCGCFAHEAVVSGPATWPVIGSVLSFLFTSPDPWVTLLRDIFLLLLAVQVLYSPVAWGRSSPSSEGPVPAFAEGSRRRTP